MIITKETTMGQMLNYDMGIADILTKSGMHCVGCPSSINETLEEACVVHGIPFEIVLASINNYITNK
ncbi:DUF1858 domain-containing protein [Anaerosporobacter sp.]|uniref:DUF1858 domain-containing protein n=1 Tax=Anaerosporobacter sp. TaxID=1872529 RepID=UPI00286F7ABC|nr:DUF1858 domain-containing protein [Anaerosporobacter sp.]